MNTLPPARSSTACATHLAVHPHSAASPSLEPQAKAHDRPPCPPPPPPRPSGIPRGHTLLSRPPAMGTKCCKHRDRNDSVTGNYIARMADRNGIEPAPGFSVRKAGPFGTAGRHRWESSGWRAMIRAIRAQGDSRIGDLSGSRRWMKPRSGRRRAVILWVGARQNAEGAPLGPEGLSVRVGPTMRRLAEG